MIARNETDIISAVSLMTVDRIREFTFVFQAFYIQTDLFYRLTSNLITDTVFQTFLSPFSSDIWTVFIIFLVLFACIGKILHFFSKKYLKYKEAMSLILETIRILSVQGTDVQLKTTALRLLLLSGQSFMLVLFSWYCGSLLNVILSPPTDSFHNVDELIQSGIHLSRQNIFYVGVGLNVSDVIFDQKKLISRPK